MTMVTDEAADTSNRIFCNRADPNWEAAAWKLEQGSSRHNACS
jgi:hypothetical protein